MIDLKRTLKKANMTQQALADDLSQIYKESGVISKQKVGYWANKSIPLIWNERLEDYFRAKEIFIYDVKR